VAGIHRRYRPSVQLREAGLRGCGIVDQGIERRPFGVLEEIAAEQLAARGQDADGAPGMPGQADDFRPKAVWGEVASLVKVKT
jgi:hypothetical protein